MAAGALCEQLGMASTSPARPATEHVARPACTRGRAASDRMGAQRFQRRFGRDATARPIRAERGHVRCPIVRARHRRRRGPRPRYRATWRPGKWHETTLSVSASSASGASAPARLAAMASGGALSGDFHRDPARPALAAEAAPTPHRQQRGGDRRPQRHRRDRLDARAGAYRADPAGVEARRRCWSSGRSARSPTPTGSRDAAGDQARAATAAATRSAFTSQGADAARPPGRIGAPRVYPRARRSRSSRDPHATRCST